MPTLSHGFDAFSQAPPMIVIEELRLREHVMW